MPIDLRDKLQATLGDAYRVEHELGGGGMSRVFVAEDMTLGRKIVVKLLLRELAVGVSAERFKREIRLAAVLQHPHIVPLLTAGDSEGLLYFSMPLVVGESLRQRLTRSGALPVVEAVRILRDVADALLFAHEHGVVHRDIKPENILMSGDHALVTDFGVAKAVSDAAATGGTLTSAGMALGTPTYMAPEQAAADPTLDHRADIYAFGILAYELLTGMPPFHGRPAGQLLIAHATAIPEPIERVRPTLPTPLSTLIMRCLEKQPSDRPKSAKELLKVLDGVAAAFTSSTAAQTGEFAVVGRAWYRRGWVIAAAAVVVLLAAGLLWMKLRA